MKTLITIVVIVISLTSCAMPVNTYRFIDHNLDSSEWEDTTIFDLKRKHALELPVRLNAEQRKLVNAIIQVESGGDDDAVGDNGNAIGCLQIWKVYWQDAVERSKLGGKYEDCYDRNYAIKVFDAYMTRYAKEKWTDPKKFDAEHVARIHNGGPKGYKKKATIKYWNKVKKELKPSDR